MKKITILLASTLILWFLALAFVQRTAMATETAGEAVEKENPVEDGGEPAAPREPARDVIRARVIAQRFHAPLSEVLELRRKKLGWGEIERLYSIAQRSGQSLDAVLALRQKGMGWGRIARQYGLKPGDIRKDVRSVNRDLRRASGEQRREHIRELVNLTGRHERQAGRFR